jgi:hypothetical protein
VSPQLRKKLEQVEREHKELKRAYFQLSLRQKSEKDGAQVGSCAPLYYPAFYQPSTRVPAFYQLAG